MQEVQTYQHRCTFAVILIVLQIILIVANIFLPLPQEKKGFYPSSSETSNLQPFTIPNLTLMLIIGFGFFISLIKRCTYSSLLLTLFAYALCIQLYFPLQILWRTIIEIKEYNIPMIEGMVNASKATLPSIIAYGAVVGRIFQREMIPLCIFCTLGYTLLQTLGIENLNVQDTGGTIFIFQYGAIFGLTVNKMLSHELSPTKKILNEIRKPHQFQYISMLGIFFLWAYWPLFNLPSEYTDSKNQCGRGVVINNTIFSLVGSTVGALLFWTFGKKKMQINQLMYVTIAGGVACGSTTTLTNEPTPFLGIGLITSFICCISFWQFSDSMENKISIYDSSFVLSSIGVPSILGGIFTIFSFSRLADQSNKDHQKNCLTFNESDYQNQAVVQLTAIIVSLISAIIIGVITGVILNSCFKEKEKTKKSLYQDQYIFEVSETDPIYFPESRIRDQEHRHQEEPLPVDFF